MTEPFNASAFRAAQKQAAQSTSRSNASLSKSEAKIRIKKNNALKPSSWFPLHVKIMMALLLGALAYFYVVSNGEANSSSFNSVDANVTSSTISQPERTYPTYTAADVSWMKATQNYKETIVASLNRIVREHEDCKSLDAYLTGLANSRSVPGKPVFFTSCTSNSGGIFNVYFKPGDELRPAAFGRITAIGKTAALTQCAAVAKANAVRPATVRVSALLDAQYSVSSGIKGRAEAVTSFKAKNVAGQTIKFNIRCLFDQATLIEKHIWTA